MLEKVLAEKTRSYEHEMKRFEWEKERHQRFNKMATDKLLEAKRTELNLDSFLERLNEREESLKSFYKVLGGLLEKITNIRFT